MESAFARKCHPEELATRDLQTRNDPAFSAWRSSGRLRLPSG
jgi:hypothetical protein